MARKSGTFHTFFDADQKETKGDEKKVKLTIDGRKIMAEKGANLLEVCQENDYKIPHLCYMKGLSCEGSCRLCIVKVKGRKS